MPNYIPISIELHEDKHWVRHTSIAFAKADTVAVLYANELVSAMHAMPIAFIRQEQGFALVVVMGLNPGENLFVSADGRWLSNYMPVTYRSSPFELLNVAGSENQQTLCIDEACVTENTEGEPFFNEEGKITESIAQAFEMVQNFNKARQLTHQICSVLAEHNLIEPWEITLNNGTEGLPVNGLYKVNETALNALSNEAFLTLRHANALPVAYAQLLSMQKLDVLTQLIQLAQASSPTEAAGETDFERETFNFSGLH